MIAFIGVRISWLIAARNVLLAWFACSAASRASRGVAEQAGVVDRDRRLLGEPDEEVEVGLGEAGARTGPPDRHHAADAVAGRCSGATISRSFVVVLGAGDRHRSRVGGDVVDELGRARGGEVADDPLAEDDPVGHDLRRRSRRARRSRRESSGRPARRRKTALVSRLEQGHAPARRSAARTRSRSSVAEISRADLGERGHLVGAALRLLDTAGRSGSPRRRSRRCVESSRASASPKRPASSVLWTLITPIASLARRGSARRGTTAPGCRRRGVPSSLELLVAVEQERLPRGRGSATSGPRRGRSAPGQRALPRSPVVRELDRRRSSASSSAT